MKILMMTNTYLPHVGGVANSVASFTKALRARGHRTVVVAPTFEGECEPDDDVVRVPAIQHFNGSDFSYRLPAPRLLSQAVEKVQPDLIHAHHPFLLGDTALRVAAGRSLPLVFTHHTMYERYTHYVPGDSPAMQQFVIRLASDYCNLCDHVIAPSESIELVLRKRGVTTPITAIPTGIDIDQFGKGDGPHARARYGIPAEALVVGHVGRLAPEKNLPLLADAMSRFAQDRPAVHCLIVGGGPSEPVVREAFQKRGIENRLHMTGPLRGQAVIDAYHAMDVFAFASETETQGMVIAEAMAAGVPVVGIDAPGVREVVRDENNGRLLPTAPPAELAGNLADALAWIADLPADRRGTLRKGARQTAASLSIDRCTDRLLKVYDAVAGQVAAQRDPDDTPWSQTRRLIEMEWSLWSHRAEAAVEVAMDAAAERFGRAVDGRDPP